MARAASRGFTLIELVVVITILGILAAFAVPKFLALDSQARIAALQGLQGSVRSATSLTHSLWLANGGTAVVIDGTTINMTNGYPAQGVGGIAETLQDLTGFTYTAATGTFSKTGAPGVCNFTYTAAPLGGTPSISAPNIAGC